MTLEGLNPIVRAKTEELLKRCQEAGIDVIITEGYRTNKRQNELYAQGRTKEGPVVTQVKGGGSYHNYGLAIDYAIKDKSGNVFWDVNRDLDADGVSDWLEVARIGKELGFAWGGDWDGFKDYPHLEMTFGFTTDELKAGAKMPTEVKTKEEDIVLNPKVANNIIDSYLSPEWHRIDEIIEHLDPGHHSIPDLIKLRDWQHTLANELRRAANITE